MRSVTTFEREDGTTSYRVRFRLNGKQTSETFRRKAEAERFAELLKPLGAQGALDQIYLEDQAEAIPTLDEMAESHIKTLTRVTDGTRTKYRSIYARVWSPTLGLLRVNNVTRHHIAEVLNGMVADGKGDKTIANAHGLLAGIMKSAIIDKHIAQSPCVGLKLPRQSDHEVMDTRFLTLDEYDELSYNMVPHFRTLLAHCLQGELRHCGRFPRSLGTAPSEGCLTQPPPAFAALLARRFHDDVRTRVPDLEPLPEPEPVAPLTLF